MTRLPSSTADKIRNGSLVASTHKTARSITACDTAYCNRSTFNAFRHTASA